MKLSELIEKLNELAQKHGDNLTVYVQIYIGDSDENRKISDIVRETDEIIIVPE